MKTILEYQNEYWKRLSLINESFSSNIIREIRDQFNDMIELAHEYNANNKYSSKDTTNNFKKIFGYQGGGGFRVQWDKITDDMFKEYTNDDRKGVALVKRMLSNRENSFDGMVINLVEDEDKGIKYSGAIISSGWSKRYINFVDPRYGIRDGDIKQSHVEEFLSKKFLLINFTENNLSANEIQSKRMQEKTGSLNPLNNPDIRDMEYKRIAERNLERYKQYAAKIKAEKEANDGIGEKVNEYSQKILDVVLNMTKNPIKYAKYEYEIGYLMDYLNDKLTWTADTKYRGHYTGKNGLLALYKTYVQKKLSLAKGDSYEHERQEYENIKKNLENMFKTIDEKLEKFKDAA